MVNEIALYKTWGEYFNYPKCCVDAFCETEVAPEYMSHSPFDGSGFVPCEECHGKTKNLRYKEANVKLGIGVDNSMALTYKACVLDTINTIKCKTFKKIAEKHGLDVFGYLALLEKSV